MSLCSHGSPCFLGKDNVWDQGSEVSAEGVCGGWGCLEGFSWPDSRTESDPASLSCSGSWGCLYPGCQYCHVILQGRQEKHPGSPLPNVWVNERQLAHTDPSLLPPSGALWTLMCSSELPVVSVFIGVYILIAVGAVMMLVGFLGCYGAIQESQCLLGTVSVSLF